MLGLYIPPYLADWYRAAAAPDRGRLKCHSRAGGIRRTSAAGAPGIRHAGRATHRPGARRHRTSRPAAADCWRSGPTPRCRATPPCTRVYLAQPGGLVVELRVADADGAYPGIDDVFPAAGRMQRAIFDLHGLRSTGTDERPWLRHAAWPARFHPLAPSAEWAGAAVSAAGRRLRVRARRGRRRARNAGGTRARRHHRARPFPLLDRRRKGAAARGAARLRAQGHRAALSAIRLQDGHRLAARVSGDSARRVLLGLLPGARGCRGRERSAAMPRGCARSRWSSSGSRITSATSARSATTPDSPSASRSSRGSRSGCCGRPSRRSDSATCSISSCRAARAATSSRSRPCELAALAVDAGPRGRRAAADLRRARRRAGPVRGRRHRCAGTRRAARPRRPRGAGQRAGRSTCAPTCRASRTASSTPRKCAGSRTATCSRGSRCASTRCANRAGWSRASRGALPSGTSRRSRCGSAGGRTRPRARSKAGAARWWSRSTAGDGRRDSALPPARPVLAQLAGARARDHRQHRARLSAHQ